jgi:hypothetical protein
MVEKDAACRFQNGDREVGFPRGPRSQRIRSPWTLLGGGPASVR